MIQKPFKIKTRKMPRCCANCKHINNDIFPGGCTLDRNFGDNAFAGCWDSICKGWELDDKYEVIK